MPLLLIPPVKLPTLVETSIAALVTEMAPLLVMPPPGAAGTKNGYVRNNDAVLPFRRDRAAIRDAAGERRDQLDLDAAGAGRNPASAVIEDAAGKDRGVVDENAGVGAPTGNRAAIGNAAQEG